MAQFKWYYRVGRVFLLPMVILYALMWAQGHQPTRDDSTVMVVQPPTCTPPAQGTLPTGVVLGTSTGYRISTNTRLVGKALEQEFNNVDSGLQVIAFCG